VEKGGAENSATTQLSEEATGIYLYALRNHVVDERDVAAELGIPLTAVESAIAPLLELKLLRRSSQSGDLVPVRPDIAAAELSAPVEEQIRAKTLELGNLRDQVLSLLPTYEEYRSAEVEIRPFERFSDPEEVRALLRIMTAECSTEVITVQPGGARDPQALIDALPRDVAMLDRGIRMLVMYQHPARGDLATRSYASKIIERGAEVRTTGQIAERLIVFDRKTAFIPDRGRAGQSPGAAVVRDPIIVAYLLRFFDQLWQEATPLDIAHIGYQDAVEDLKLSIVRLMARGLSDEAVARRLGMGLRTCRRHIAAIMHDLGAVSRFQAGCAAQQRGFLGASSESGQAVDSPRRTGS